MNKHLPHIYLITDRHQICADRNYFDVIEELLAAGVGMMQLREKDLSSAELYIRAKKLRELTDAYNCLLLINDRIDIAQAVQADGVHLGQQSLSPIVARKILGPEAVIGVSTHNRTEALSAMTEGANFITYGPVYQTPSKVRYGPPVGIKSLGQVCQEIPIPVFALGGIRKNHLKELKRQSIRDE